MKQKLNLVKKKTIVIMLLCFFASAGFSQSFIPKGIYHSPFQKEKSSNKKGSSNKTVELIVSGGYQNFSSNIGYTRNISASAFTTGLDSLYRHSSGFVFFFNNAFNFGLCLESRYRPGGYGFFGWTGELLFGYEKYFSGHGVRFGLGYQASASTDLIEFAAFASRLEYLYTFNKGMKLSVSLNEAVGGSFDYGLINSFALKIGVGFNL